MRPEDAALAIAADVLDDLERTRIANENRLRAVTDDGLGDSLEADAIRNVVAGIGALEHQAELSLKRALRRHPLGPWIKATVGIGEKQGARLLAAIGDPYWNSLHDRPRLVSELWAYAGYHVSRVDHPVHGTQSRFVNSGQPPADQVSADIHCVRVGGTKQGDPGQFMDDVQRQPAGVAPKRRRNQRANWSGTAKMRAYLVAESCIKQRTSPYRAVYDDGRIKYADAVHAVPCERCGPKGKPAPVGSPLSDGHKHARAMRLVSKEILRDLWREAKRLHQLPADHAARDAQLACVGGPQTSPGHNAHDIHLLVAGAGQVA